MKVFKKRLTLFFLLLPFYSAFAQVKLPQLVSDGMVLQRQTELKIWGWASPGEKISIEFRKKKYSGQADKHGNWQVMLPQQNAGGPYSMKIKGKNEIKLENILIGDVWLCSGQSNMEHFFGVHQERFAEEISQASNTEIRQFNIPMTPVLTGPQDDFPVIQWKAATADNILEFSVVAYFFAKNLHEKYGIPIGIIKSTVGGSPIEAWISEEGLMEFPDIMSTVERNKDTAFVFSENRKADVINQQIAEERPKDEGLTGEKHWYDPAYQVKDWGNINIPGYWEDQGVQNLDGIVWFRKEIEVPVHMVGKPAKVKLGRIVDADELYINGKKVGNTSYQYPQRRYDVPADLLKTGKNVFTIRLTNYGGKGGFVTDKPYYLATENDTIDLKGYWDYKIGSVFPKTKRNPGGISMRHQPASFYNGMIAPATNYKVKGFAWYQGESNAGRPYIYEALQKAQIKDWRKKWNNEKLPFLFVQLPNFMDANYLPSESNWAALRQAQLNALSVPNTGMAIAIDLGEWNDIHPGNKKPVGDRLALAAQKLAYGETNVVSSGPIFKSARMEEGKVILTFDHVGSGLIARDGKPLRWFALAGADRDFQWAETKIENTQVVLSSEEVKNPVYVRYAWADNPDQVNFYNLEGLPASPFEAELPAAKQRWYGKKAAVVLTYDDALEVHLDHAIPALEERGFVGTFYLSANYEGSENRIADWRRAAQRGHELGNHTLYHPCDNSDGTRTWITPENDLANYTTAQIVREVHMTNVFLKALDGKSERTFAYTCGDTETSEGSFVEAIKDQFVALRGVHGDVNRIGEMDFTSLNCYVVDNSNADQLVKWAEKAKAENALLVVLFHGVGGGHPLNIDLDKHNAFLDYLKSNEEDFWVTTLLEASKHAKEHKK
ncbi:hypothetical protein C9994_04610 [Marivirga lumbricoides]|uniref:NodB homology domain-containing protein n=1 Tax=Marivirga lumbricoides TaxID=1046115 RepID=A0A2T4DTL8_9BACT|nr:hypothetical protein C9994_04610 [Marivirga lumbricoides]